MIEILDQPIRQQVQALRAGELTASDLLEAALKRIEQRDLVLNSIIHLDRDGARQAALQIDAMLQSGQDIGPLAGIPVAVKDLADIRGMPGYCGSHAFDPTPPLQDSSVAARLRRAGAVLIGKTATYEFALTGPAWDQPYPPARNPWNRDHITGGSSSGSAAAVAGGLIRASIGTDTGGSIRSPASYCGIVGLKPTRGMVAPEGVFPLSGTLDTIGPLAACVEDAALVLDAIADTQAASRIGQPVKGMSIGFARNWLSTDSLAQPAVIEALDNAASQFSLIGTKIELIELPKYDLFEATGCVILQSEALAVHRERFGEHYADYGIDARRNLISGAVLSAEDVAAAYTLAQRLTQQIDRALEGRDALITATTLQTAPAFADFGDGAAWTPMRTFPFNVTGHPAISLPCGFSGGLPIGLQIIARHGEEARLCQLADAFEKATAYATARPSFY